jgi:hypothetical protein
MVLFNKITLHRIPVCMEQFITCSIQWYTVTYRNYTDSNMCGIYSVQTNFSFCFDQTCLIFKTSRKSTTTVKSTRIYWAGDNITVKRINAVDSFQMYIVKEWQFHRLHGIVKTDSHSAGSPLGLTAILSVPGTVYMICCYNSL